MKSSIAILIMVFVVWPILFYIAVDLKSDRGVTYDCRLAEISPDYPPEVKNACRKLRTQQITT